MKRLCLLLPMLIMCSTGHAQDARTRSEFLQTRAETIAQIKEQNQVIETKEKQLIKLLVTRSITGEEYGKNSRIYYLTAGGNYAHPSIMEVKLLENNGSYTVHRSGSTGTSRVLFDKWMSQMRWRDAEDMNEILGIKPAVDAMPASPPASGPAY